MKNSVRIANEVLAKEDAQLKRRTTKLQAIIEAAAQKFGEVIEARQSEFDNTMHVLVIKRDQPVFADVPYMSIKAYTNETGQVCFVAGHYDLSLENAKERR